MFAARELHMCFFFRASDLPPMNRRALVRRPLSFPTGKGRGKEGLEGPCLFPASCNRVFFCARKGINRRDRERARAGAPPRSLFFSFLRGWVRGLRGEWMEVPMPFLAACSRSVLAAHVSILSPIS
jgi:hypothetical protein